MPSPIWTFWNLTLPISTFCSLTFLDIRPSHRRPFSRFDLSADSNFSASHFRIRPTGVRPSGLPPDSRIPYIYVNPLRTKSSAPQEFCSSVVLLVMLMKLYKTLFLRDELHFLSIPFCDVRYIHECFIYKNFSFLCK